MKKTIDLSIIIVNYNTSELLAACLQSLKSASTKGFTSEIIVVDNGSRDDSRDIVSKNFPDIIFLPQTENLGFAAANNIGIKKSKGSYILLLNSDTEVQPNALSVMINFLKNHHQ